MRLDFVRTTTSWHAGRRIVLAVVAGLLVGCLLLMFLRVVPASAVTPANFTDTLIMKIGSPTALAFNPDGRLLVTTAPGTLRVYKDGALLPNPALDISGKVCTNGGRGLGSPLTQTSPPTTTSTSTTLSRSTVFASRTPPRCQ